VLKCFYLNKNMFRYTQSVIFFLLLIFSVTAILQNIFEGLLLGVFCIGLVGELHRDTRKLVIT